MTYRFVFATLTLACCTTMHMFAQTTANTATRRFNFPPVGLGSTETARVNLTNTASNSNNGTAASCTGTVTFLNAGGTAIGTATTFTATSGQTASVSLPFASAGLSGNRGVIRAMVALTLSGPPVAPCSLMTSFETFETSSGATHALVSGGPEVGIISFRGN